MNLTEHQLELAARKPSVADIPEAELIKRAIRSARARGYGPAPRWSIVMDIFALGSTYAAQLCIAHGFDPDAPIGRNGEIKRKAPAIAQPAQAEPQEPT